MSERLKLPVGIEDFGEIRTEGFYYVDKTALIEQLFNNWGKVNLFTRPRRFGKSLNMSMLKYFFEIGTDNTLFDGLYISQNKELCEKHRQQYPVISITLKGVEGQSFEEAKRRLIRIIGDEAERLNILSESNNLSAGERDDYKALTAKKDGMFMMNEDTFSSSLKILSKLLYKHFGKKAVILIDEYDVPLDKAYQYGYYEEMTSLLRTVFGDALKTNEYLYFAVMTGCLRVSKESIFTGLNNMKVHSISDERFDEYFGFTDAEIRQMLTYYGLEEHYEESREWYDGYRFGEQYVYCPWDVINYCDDLIGSVHAEPKAYWLNTSGNSMVRELISAASNGTAQMDIEQLIEGETIVKRLNEQLTHNEINDSIDNIWSLLYMTGYLTLTERPSAGVYKLCIPNREVLEIYKQQVLAWFKDKANAETKTLEGLYAAFEGGDTQSITEILSDQLYDTVSFYDAYESFYHGFLLALLSTCNQWNVTSNPETGRGRSDIVVCRKDRKMGFVIEVKNVKEERQLETACSNAIKQIEDRDYTAMLKKYGIKNTIAYGIAFWDKSCIVMKSK